MLIENYEMTSDQFLKIIDRHTAISNVEPKDVMCIYSDKGHCMRNCVCYSETKPLLIGNQKLVIWTCARCGVMRYMLIDGDRIEIMKANGGKIYGDL